MEQLSVINISHLTWKGKLPFTSVAEFHNATQIFELKFAQIEGQGKNSFMVWLFFF